MAAHFPAGLVSASAIRKIEDVVNWFPAAITNTFCFEIELKEQSFTSDYSFVCRRNEIGVEILAGRSDIHLPEELFTNSIWRDLRSFCYAWSEPSSWIRESIMYLWLEFDINQVRPVPSPLIFLGIPHYCCTNVSDLISILEMLKYPASERFIDMLRQCTQWASKACNIFEIALMFSRQTDRVRFVFHGVDHSILSLLTELGFEDLAEVKRIIADLQGMDNHLTVDIDAGDTIGPKIGLECQFSGNVRMDQPRWERALDYLVTVGLCTVEKRDALLKWPGGSEEKLDHLLLPAKAIRKINHYKIVWQRDAPLQAKAYLLARFF